MRIQFIVPIIVAGTFVTALPAFAMQPPAAVEADPARLIKVLPPLSGRVTQLKVQLGEQVEAGQPLVVIDSPDLAAAYADYDRATNHGVTQGASLGNIRRREPN